jgi:hypothetical protein
LDLAKQHIIEAIKLEPKNTQIRKEYDELINLKTKKEKEWYLKMSGFYNTDKLKKIENKE